PADGVPSSALGGGRAADEYGIASRSVYHGVTAVLPPPPMVGTVDCIRGRTTGGGTNVRFTRSRRPLAGTPDRHARRIRALSLRGRRRGSGHSPASPGVDDSCVGSYCNGIRRPFPLDRQRLRACTRRCTAGRRPRLRGGRTRPLHVLVCVARRRPATAVPPH